MSDLCEKNIARAKAIKDTVARCRTPIDRSIAHRQARNEWRERGTQIREPDGPGRATTRAALRQPTLRVERTGPDDAHNSKLTRPSLTTRRKRRRAQNAAARDARRANR